MGLRCGKYSDSPSQTSLLPDTLGEITARHATGGVLPSGQLEGRNSISRKMQGDRHRVGILWIDHSQNSSGSIQACPPLKRPRKRLQTLRWGSENAERAQRRRMVRVILFEMGGLSPEFQRLKVVNPLRFKPPVHRDLYRFENSLLRHRTGPKRIRRPRAWHWCLERGRLCLFCHQGGRPTCP